MIPRFTINLTLYELFKILISKGNVKNFEKKFLSTFKLKFPISFSYGRSAIYCFLKALNIKNKNVIMPAYTCSVIAHAIVIGGNKPLFIDVDKDTFNFNLKEFSKKINKNTACVILTNTFGVAQDVIKIQKIIRTKEKIFKNKIYLIQDCCHSFDAKFKNKKITEYGDMILFSFNISKTITSIFGSIATFNDKNLFKIVKAYRDKNFKKKTLGKIFLRFLYIFFAVIFFNKNLYFFTHFLQNKTKILKKFTDNYHLDEKISFPKDYNTLLTNLEAKVGLFQLSKYFLIKKTKIYISKYYSKILSKKKNIKIIKFNKDHTYSHFPIIVKNKYKTIKQFSKYGYELGEVIQYSIPNLKTYRSKRKYHNSDFLSKHTINLPNHIKVEKKYLDLI